MTDYLKDEEDEEILRVYIKNSLSNK